MRLLRTVLGALIALAGVVMGLAAVAGNGDAEAPDPRRAANVAVIGPQITARTADSTDRPIPGEVREGDRLTSDGSGIARIDWFDGSVTRMGPSSSITL